MSSIKERMAALQVAASESSPPSSSSKPAPSKLRKESISEKFGGSLKVSNEQADSSSNRVPPSERIVGKLSRDSISEKFGGSMKAPDDTEDTRVNPNVQEANAICTAVANDEKPNVAIQKKKENTNNTGPNVPPPPAEPSIKRNGSLKIIMGGGPVGGKRISINLCYGHLFVNMSSLISFRKNNSLSGDAKNNKLHSLKLS